MHRRGGGSGSWQLVGVLQGSNAQSSSAAGRQGQQSSSAKFFAERKEMIKICTTPLLQSKQPADTNQDGAHGTMTVRAAC
eukprot:1149501-Pelagomonas_calceolata.AAC.3